MNKILGVENLTCQRREQILFANLSFQLQQGQCLVIEGVNGSGKSTLLRILSGLMSPDGGEIFWQQQLIQKKFTHYINQLHYIGHQNGLKLGLTVSENLQLAHHLATFSSCNELDEILHALQLSIHKNTPLHYLSAGQKRKCALARLLLCKKDLWLLDEPFTALDNSTQIFFLAALKQHLQQNGMVIISTHQPLALTAVDTQTLSLGSC